MHCWVGAVGTGAMAVSLLVRALRKLTNLGVTIVAGALSAGTAVAIGFAYWVIVVIMGAAAFTTLASLSTTEGGTKLRDCLMGNMVRTEAVEAEPDGEPGRTLPTAEE